MDRLVDADRDCSLAATHTHTHILMRYIQGHKLNTMADRYIYVVKVGGIAEWVERWSRPANFPYPVPDC